MIRPLDIFERAILCIGLIAIGACAVLVWMVTRADFERGLSYRGTQIVERVYQK